MDHRYYIKLFKKGENLTPYPENSRSWPNQVTFFGFFYPSIFSKSSVIELDAIETVKYLRLAFSRNDNNISTPLQNLRNIKLYFASKWPFNVIVDEKMMEIYTSVSSFLLSLLYARWKLDAIWIQRGIPKNQQMHEIQLIRCEMVQFLRGFSNFVFQSIIAAQWFSFVQRITEFNDKNELDLDRTGK